MKRSQIWLPALGWIAALAAATAAVFPWSVASAPDGNHTSPRAVKALTDLRMHVPPFDGVTPRRMETLAPLELGLDLHERKPATALPAATQPTPAARDKSRSDWLDLTTDADEAPALDDTTPRWGWLADQVQQTRQDQAWRDRRDRLDATAPDAASPLTWEPENDEAAGEANPFAWPDETPARRTSASLPGELPSFDDQFPATGNNAAAPPDAMPANTLKRDEAWPEWPR